MRFLLNGEEQTVVVEPRALLSDTIRHRLGLSGTHVGCEQGACGACTVLVDGRPVRSCLMLAPQADGATIETVESVARPDGALHPVQQALASAHGLQCGFCTPGIVMSLLWAYREGLSATTTCTEVLGGHLCRCTGYVNLRAAIIAAWAERDATNGPDGPAGLGGHRG